MTFPVFIGHDSREEDAFRVCQFSLYDKTTVPIQVHALKHRELRQLGLFSRPWRITAEGQYVDERDGKPFSTEFSHLRFLVPALVDLTRMRSPWALFCDCDFLWRADVGELLAKADPRFAVMVVKHFHAPPEGVKMDGMAQTRYSRKNWSSLILWNLVHPLNRDLTADNVNNETGAWLHSFGWLPDEAIGALPIEWNWLVGHSPPDIDPKAVHFTEGGPWFEKYRDVPYAEEWRRALSASMHPRPSVVERMAKCRT